MLNNLWTTVQESLTSFNYSSRMKFTSADLGLVNKFWALIQIIAIGMTIIYFLMELNRAWLYEGREMTVKTFGAPFIKFAIALGVLQVSKKLVGWILSGCNALISSADSLESDLTPDTPQANMFENVTLWTFIVYILILFIFVLVSQIISLVFLYKIVVFKLEFLLRLCATPIALSDIYSGANSLGVKWLKGLFAMGLYGAFLVLLPKIGLAYMGGPLNDYNNAANIGAIGQFFRAFIAAIVVPIAEIGAMSVARQVSKEALGV